MSIDYLFPINKSHAIQNVVFALEWQGELTDNALIEIHKLAPVLKSHFPLNSVQKLVKFNVESALNNASTVQQEEGEHLGVVFQRVDKSNKVVSQLNVSRSNCVIVINEYSRWIPTLEAVMRYFKIVLPAIMKEKSINIINLQYVDVFTWRDEPINLNLCEIFKKDTPYLAPNVFDQKGLWHCHHGYLVEQLAGLDGDGRCLNNINVAAIDNQDNREIYIHTTHQFTLNSPLRMASKDYLQSIEKIQNALHGHNKDILRQLLTDEVCTKINLKGVKSEILI